MMWRASIGTCGTYALWRSQTIWRGSQRLVQRGHREPNTLKIRTKLPSTNVKGIKEVKVHVGPRMFEKAIWKDINKGPSHSFFHHLVVCFISYALYTSNLVIAYFGGETFLGFVILVRPSILDRVWSYTITHLVEVSALVFEVYFNGIKLLLQLFVLVHFFFNFLLWYVKP